MSLNTVEIGALVARTQDAHMAQSYGEHWAAIIVWLSEEKGWNEQEIEAILRSKYMRWSNDESNACTLQAFQHFYRIADERFYYFSNDTIAELVDDTFPPADDAERKARKEARLDRVVEQHMASLARVQESTGWWSGFPDRPEVAIMSVHNLQGPLQAVAMVVWRGGMTGATVPEIATQTRQEAIDVETRLAMLRDLEGYEATSVKRDDQPVWMTCANYGWWKRFHDPDRLTVS